MLVVVPLILHVSTRGLVIFLVALLVFLLKVIKPLWNQTSLLSNQNARPQKVTPPRAKRRHKHMWVCHARTHVDCINSVTLWLFVYLYLTMHYMHCMRRPCKHSIWTRARERGGERERGGGEYLNKYFDEASVCVRDLRRQSMADQRQTSMVKALSPLASKSFRLLIDVFIGNQTYNISDLRVHRLERIQRDCVYGEGFWVYCV